jgi:hypothetical protein
MIQLMVVYCFVDNSLWSYYEQQADALWEYLDKATVHIDLRRFVQGLG